VGKISQTGLSVCGGGKCRGHGGGLNKIRLQSFTVKYGPHTFMSAGSYYIMYINIVHFNTHTHTHTHIRSVYYIILLYSLCTNRVGIVCYYIISYYIIYYYYYYTTHTLYHTRNLRIVCICIAHENLPRRANETILTFPPRRQYTVYYTIIYECALYYCDCTYYYTYIYFGA